MLIGGPSRGHLDLFQARTTFNVGTFQDDGGTTCAEFSPDGQLLLSGAIDSAVCLWDLSSLGTSLARPTTTSPAKRQFRPLHKFNVHSAGITAVAWAPDGQCFASGSKDGTVVIWDVSRAARYHEFESALARARAALQQNPQDGAALQCFGDWYAFRGMDQWAADFYEQARAAGAKVPHLALARSYWKLNRPQDARREFNGAIDDQEAPAEYLSLCLNAVAVTSRNARAGR
jgi:hypothetical protein